uniref:Uncharacterized protein n=1 Tax=Anguilla anguilla TaxID=7936 RepID=A0A0E9QKR3_ANGAN
MKLTAEKLGPISCAGEPSEGSYFVSSLLNTRIKSFEGVYFYILDIGFRSAYYNLE